MSSLLQVLTLTGVFYEDSGDIQVADEAEGTVSVLDKLRPLRTLPVRVLAHHLPPNPPVKERWGGGSCYFQESGHCPSGHHANPGWLYTFNRSGTLDCLDGSWVVLMSTGDRHPIELNQLIGHRAQLVVMTLPDPEDLKRRVEELRPENMKNASMEDLMDRTREMISLLEEIKTLKEDLE